MPEIVEANRPHAGLLAEPPEDAADIPRVERGADRCGEDQVPRVPLSERSCCESLLNLAPAVDTQGLTENLREDQDPAGCRTLRGDECWFS